MPNITQYTAGGQPAVLNITERRFPQPSYAGEAFLGESITDVGKNLGLIAGGMARERALLEQELIKTQKKINLTDMDSLYRAGITSINNDLVTPQFDEQGNITREAVNPFQHVEEFAKREQALREAIAPQAMSPDVALAFRNTVGANLPSAIMFIKHRAEMQIVSQQRAKIEQTLMDDAGKIGAELDPVVRDSMKTRSSAATLLQTSTRIFGPEEAVKLRHNWEQKIDASNMQAVADRLGADEMFRRLARGEWRELDISKKLAIAHQVKAAAEHAENLAAKAQNKLNHELYDYVYGQMARGNRGPFEDALRAGTFPGLRQEQQVHLYNLKELGVEKKLGREAVLAIIQEYEGGEDWTGAAYTKAKKALNALSLEYGNANEQIVKGLEHVNSTKLKIDGQVRAEVGQVRADESLRLREEAANRARIEADVKKGLDYYHANIAKPGKYTDFTGNRKNEQIIDAKNIELAIRTGQRKWDEIAKERVDAWNKRYNEQPQTHKDIDTLRSLTPQGQPGGVERLLRD